MRLWLLTIFCVTILSESIFSFTRVLFNFNDFQYFKEELCNLILQADNYIKIVTFNLDFEEIEDLLIGKSFEGVTISLVIDDSNSFKKMHLKNYGISVLDDSTSKEFKGLVHSKFVIIDGKYVWFGSANITESSFFKDHNYAFISDDKKVVKTFEEEFRNFLNLKFHNSKKDFSDRESKVFFSPVHNISNEIVKVLSKAKEEVWVCMYAFTDFEIFNQLKILSANGVRIRLILDETWNLYNGFRYSVLEDGLDFFEMRLDPFGGLLHDKFILIDPGRKNGLVCAGSYNLTLSADNSNDEFFVFFDSQNIVEKFREEFEKIWNNSKKF